MNTSMKLLLGAAATLSTALAADIGTPGLVLLARHKDGEPLRTASAIPGSPAAKARIPPAGFLISVNSTNVVSMSLTQALSMVRGTPGTSVVLEIADATMRHTNKFTLKRGRLVHSLNRLEVIEP